VKRPIEAAVLDRLGHMGRADLRGGVEIGDGARDLERCPAERRPARGTEVAAAG
jgi:hypothetical protein